MPQEPFEVLIAILWSVTILALASTWLPALFSWLGASSWIFSATNNIERLEPTAGEPEYAWWFKQLILLGYDPVGEGDVRIIYNVDSWGGFIPLRLFYSDSKKRFAIVERMATYSSPWFVVRFVSLLSEEGLLITTNIPPVAPSHFGSFEATNRTAEEATSEDNGAKRRSGGDATIEDDFINQGILTTDLTQLEAIHDKTQKVILTGSRRLDSDQSISNLVHLLTTRYGKAMKMAVRQSGRKFLFVHILIHLSLSFPIIFMLGPLHWGLPLTNLILSSMFWFGESAEERQLHAMIREALLKKISDEV